MCGIAGIALPPERAVDPAHAAALERALRHRGPDDLGFLAWPGGAAEAAVARDAQALPTAPTWLVHRRLSIIDTGEGGRQPMRSHDGALALVFNGEIYNYRELRAELETAGHAFRTESDTEVLLTALEAWGEAALPRLTGMFAFALLDCRRGELLLGRDPFGMKPLYQASFRGGIAFASEIKALLALPGVARRADAPTVRRYLETGRSDSGTTTFFESIRQLPAAHVLRLSVARPDMTTTPGRYWSPGTDVPFAGSEAEAAELLRDKFRESVRLHLRSDVPIGTALSGGIDSSSVAAVTRSLAGDVLPLHAFSFVAPGEPFDESRWVDSIAAATRCRSHRTRPADAILPDDLEAMLQAQDEPVVGTGMLAQYMVFRLAGQNGIKVTLDGQGADEYLAGYPTFLASAVAARLREGAVCRALHLAAARPGEELGLGGLALRVLPFLLPSGIAERLRARHAAHAAHHWLERTFGAGEGEPARQSEPGTQRSPLKRHLVATLSETSLPQLLRYADRNSMRFSVESRLPFLTTELVDFALSLPDRHILADDGTSKAVFRRAMRGCVPDNVLDRRDKIGFVTPQDAWLRATGRWLDEQVDRAESLPMVRKGVLTQMLAASRATARPVPAHVWRVANLAFWAETSGVKF